MKEPFELLNVLIDNYWLNEVTEQVSSNLLKIYLEVYFGIYPFSYWCSQVANFTMLKTETSPYEVSKIALDNIMLTI